ncbi:MAG: SDR family NAD(P)-dependent oxidoreductase [Coprobacillaceae bacterium]
MRNKIVVITGVTKGIGKAIADAFKKQGAIVCGIDVLENDYFVGDIADKDTVVSFCQKVILEHKKIDYLINNACLSKGGINDCSYEDFNYVLRVGVSAPYLLTQQFKDHFNPNGAIVNISSTRYLMSQANTESYTAAKGAISSLTHALAVSLAGIVRVNAIAPGWIDVTNSTFEGSDNTQHPVQRVGIPEDIVNAVMFLCSEESSFITGQILNVDGGMTKQMIYHDDKGWEYNEKK